MESTNKLYFGKPVFMVLYNNRSLAVYTQAFRCLVLIRHCLSKNSNLFKDCFRVLRYSVSKDDPLVNVIKDVSESFLNAL